jgi:membrane-associated protease RseP (regulator of RpoE activity)
LIKKYLTFRIWILIIALALSFISIRPDPYAEGVAVTTVASGSPEAQNGIAPGDIILSVDGDKINNIADLQTAINEFSPEPKEIIVRTDLGTFRYNVTDDIMFNVVNNTITDIKENVINGTELISINDERFDNNLDEIIGKVLPARKIMIETDKGQIVYLSRTKPQISGKVLEKSNIKFGLDLVGGTRVLLKPVADRPISDQEIIDIIKIMSNRLNVYGLADLSIRSASDFEGNKFIMVEMPGATIEEARDIIARQGNLRQR